MKITIVGAGLAGICMANLLAEQGHQIKIFEKSGGLGGLCRDEYHCGVLIHPKGPHTLRTNNKKVMDYLSKFTKWHTDFEYRVNSYDLDGAYPLPVNMTTVNRIFKTNFTEPEQVKHLFQLISENIPDPKNSEEAVVSKVGRLIYEKLFENYTKKFWGIHPIDLDPDVCSRVPVRYDNNMNYFVNKKYVALPKEGYSDMLEKMIRHPNIEIEFYVDISDLKSYRLRKSDLLIWTGPIDKAFDYKYGCLPYRSIKFVKKEYQMEYIDNVVQIVHPTGEFPQTRDIELKHITKQKCPNTVVVSEYPSDKGEPMYPIPTKKAKKIYEKYKKKANKLKDVMFIGRLAQYEYIDMDQIVERCLDLAEHLNKKQGGD